MKKLPIFIVTAVSLIGISCQESANKDGKQESTQEQTSTVSQDTAHQGLEGTQDESAHLSTDVKADTSSGQMQHSDQNLASENKDAKSTKDQDANFISEEVGGNYAEISAAESALHKSGSQEAKSISSMLKKEHTASLNELKLMSSKKGITVPADASADLKVALTNVETKTGSAYDKAWCEMLIEKHKKTIDKYESTAKSTSDANLKGWINKTLPKLRMHLDKLMAFNGKISA